MSDLLSKFFPFARRITPSAEAPDSVRYFHRATCTISQSGLAPSVARRSSRCRLPCTSAKEAHRLNIAPVNGSLDGIPGNAFVYGIDVVNQRICVLFRRFSGGVWRFFFPETRTRRLKRGGVWKRNRCPAHRPAPKSR